MRVLDRRPQHTGIISAHAWKLCYFIECRMRMIAAWFGESIVPLMPNTMQCRAVQHQTAARVVAPVALNLQGLVRVETMQLPMMQWALYARSQQ